MRSSEAERLHQRHKVSTLTLTFLRVSVGLLFMAHGWQKLADIPGTIAAFEDLGLPSPASSTYLAILGELFGGLGLVLGALTPLAALGTALVMVSAIVFVHRGSGPFASNGGWEYPLVLLAVSLYFMTRGPGPLSIDALLRRQRRRRAKGRREAHAASRP